MLAPRQSTARSYPNSQPKESCSIERWKRKDALFVKLLLSLMTERKRQKRSFAFWDHKSFVNSRLKYFDGNEKCISLSLLSFTRLIFLLWNSFGWQHNIQNIVDQFVFQDSVVNGGWREWRRCIHFDKPGFQVVINNYWNWIYFNTRIIRRTNSSPYCRNHSTRSSDDHSP